MVLKRKPKLQGFFAKEETPADWEKHWRDMPEFKQRRHNECYCELTVRVRTKEDLEDLAKLVDQELTGKTKTIWYPKLIRERVLHKKYVHDESEVCQD